MNYEQYGTLGVILEKLLPKLKKWGNLSGEPKFIGGGTQGYAFRFGDKVLKITRDEYEASTCSYLMSLGNKHPNIYNIYKVGKFTFKKATMKIKVYFIVQEFLNDPNYEIRTVLETYDWDLNVGFSPDDFSTEEELEEHVHERVMEKFGNPKISKYAVQAFSAAKYLWDIGVRSSQSGDLWNDWHSMNVGMRGDDLVLFDVGYSDSPREGKIDTLEEIVKRIINELIKEENNAK